MASSLRPVRILVWSTALLLTTVALAGCHDLPNTFSDDGLEPEGASGDEADDGSGDGEEEGGDDGQDSGDDGAEDGGGDDGGDNGGDDGGNDDGGDDGGENDGGDDDDGGDDGGEEDENGTDAPVVEEGDFDEDHVVDIVATSIVSGCSEDEYSPQTLDIEIGEVIRWFNDGGCSHTATSGEEWDEEDGLFDTGSVSDGEHSENSYRFNEAGTYKYYCSFHPNMEIAQIVVS